MPPKPFKPPRPSITTKKATKAKSTAVSKSKEKAASTATKTKARTSGSTTFSRPSIASSLALDASDSDDDPFASDPDPEPQPQPGREVLDVDMEEAAEEERTEYIPETLINRLLHENFKEDGTRMTKESVVIATKYMEIFVREAIARASDEALKKQEASGMGGGDIFLEVEDLEKQAPQLLLDF